MKKILIVEDDEDIGNIVAGELAKDGYEILRAYSGTEGRLMLSKNPDLILMDLMLPGMTGEELLTHIGPGIPVIAVSARSSIDDKISLLGSGCVDYITKPFDIRELKARVRTSLRHFSSDHSSNLIKVSDIELDADKHQVTVSGEPVKLTRTEYAILKILMSSPGRVISKSEILDLISEDTPDCMESSLKVHISNLRKKLKAAGNKDYIEAVWGIGFKIG